MKNPVTLTSVTLTSLIPIVPNLIVPLISKKQPTSLTSRDFVAQQSTRKPQFLFQSIRPSSNQIASPIPILS